MDGWGLLLAAGFGGLILHHWRLARKDQRAKEESEARERERQKDNEAKIATAAWLELKAVFPFLPTPEIPEPTADRIYQEIAVTVHVPKRIGTIARGHETFWLDFQGVPVPTLPPSQRRRHLYVVGKTGSGKSTFLEHLIAQDLEDGRGVGVMSPEGELFRHRLLPMIPRDRWDEVIYFAPGNPQCRLTYNPLAIEPGEDSLRAAEDLFTVFKRTLGGEDLSARMQPILQNAFAALVGRPGATLWDVKRLLEDAKFREEVIATCPDAYIGAFWKETYPRYARGADLPILNRLDQFLRPPTIRRVLCQPQSSFSIREALAEGRILLIDLFGLSEENRLIIGQMLLSKMQLELMRRERMGGEQDLFYLYADEFQSFAGVAEGTWRELLSRGRKYGLCLTLANQYPAQLPPGLQAEIFGNVNSLVAFALGAKDAHAVKNELLQTRVGRNGVEVGPIPPEGLIDLTTGEAYAKLGGGRAVRIETLVPLDIATLPVETLIEESWARYGATRIESLEPPRRAPQRPPERKEGPRAPIMPPPEEAEIIPRRDHATPQVERPPTRHVPPAVLPPAPLPAIPEPAPIAPALAQAAQTAVPRELPRPGRGGAQHKYLQELVKRFGEERKYRALIEHEILGGVGRVDVALSKGKRRIACEISVTTSGEHELGNIQKCIAAGFERVVVLSPERRVLDRIEELAKGSLSEAESSRLSFLTPDEFWLFLETIDAEAVPTETTVRGYKVKVRYKALNEEEVAARKKAIAQTVLQGLRRLR